MSGIYDLIRASLEKYPQNDNDTIAVDVLNELRVARKAAEVLVPLVAAAVGNQRRAVTRGLERHAFTGERGEKLPLELPHDGRMDPITARRWLIEHTFALKDGRRVLWGEATVQDHEERISLIDGQIVGLRATIKRHAEAIDLIREAGVSCLNEIEGWAA